MSILKLMAAISLVISSFVLTSCAVNPVTGRNDFSIISEQRELSIGAQQYEPSQQGQGGVFSIDEELSVYVNQVGQRLASVSDRDLPYEFVVLNNSVPNAWALPGGKIAVNRGLLLELNSEAELAAVLGHEVVHAAARHGALAMSRGTLLQGALLIGSIAAHDNEYEDYIVGGSQLGAQLLSQRYSRSAETESDYYGIEYMLRAGYDPRAAISLQETFVRLSEGQNPSWIEGMFASHPPSEQRVADNREHVDQLMPLLESLDLEVGTERYQQATAYLNETSEAYAIFDGAMEAIADDDLEIAMGNLDEAISLVPQEARFYGLKADILLSQRRYREATRQYTEAINIDDHYFDYYLGRGVAHSRQGSADLARRDLEQSANLLPTAIAMNELGKLSLQSNDREAAKQYFQMATSAQGLVGEEASDAYIRLDIEDSPAAYIQVEVFADGNGRIFARITNRSSLTLEGISVDFSAALGARVGQNRRTLNSLRAGASRELDSGLKFPQGMQWNEDQMQATVISARVAGDSRK